MRRSWTPAGLGAGLTAVGLVARGMTAEPEGLGALIASRGAGVRAELFGAGMCWRFALREGRGDG